MSHDLTSVKVATLVAAGFEQDHLLESQKFLHRAGATVTTVSAAAEPVSGADKTGGPLATINLERAEEAGFDALLLPGGQKSADDLSRNRKATDFIRAFLTAAKPVGAIADGAKVLIATGCVAGRRITGHPALKEPVQEAGGVWVNDPVATDGNLVTAVDMQPNESFCDAFAKICEERKADSGPSLHTD